MAGLGEACTHVAALLFHLETAARINGAMSYTQQKCQWVIPTFQKKIPYLPVKEIDFTSPSTKKRRVDELSSSSASLISASSSQVRSLEIKPPNEKELDIFFGKLKECNSKPALLSLIPEYASAYISKTQLDNFPIALQSLFHTNYQDMRYNDLLLACENITINVSDEMAVAVEEEHEVKAPQDCGTSTVQEELQLLA